MPKQQFLYAETKPIFDLIEETSQRSGVSRGQAFEDFLHMSLCALSGRQMGAHYMQTVQRHVAGQSRSIQFKTLGGVAGSRLISFSVDDGDGRDSGEAVKVVNVT